jgi:transposase
MRSMRKRLDAVTKAKIALEAIRGEKTLAEIAKAYKVHPNQIAQWKKQALRTLPDVFSKRKLKEEDEAKAREDELYKQIGQLKVEVEFLKKKSAQLGKL